VISDRRLLLEAADEALTELIKVMDKRPSAKWDTALEEAADVLEEYLGEMVGKIVTPLILGMSQNLSEAEKVILHEVQELRKRREAREKRRDMEG